MEYYAIVRKNQIPAKWNGKLSMSCKIVAEQYMQKVYSNAINKHTQVYLHVFRIRNRSGRVDTKC